MKATPEAMKVINTVCAGQPNDCATWFIGRMPEIQTAFKNMDWHKNSVPEVAEGGQDSFLIVWENKDSVIDKKLFVREATYFHASELNIEDPAAYFDQGYGIQVKKDEWDDLTYLYTGWAFDTSSEDGNFYEFIKDEDVKAWRNHPELPDLDALEG